MKKALALVALSSCLLAAGPALAQNGTATGACVVSTLLPREAGPETGVEGGFFGSLCIDDLTNAECDQLCVAGIDPEGGAVVCEDFPGEVCANLGPWDGACDGVSSPVGTVCAVIAASDPDDSPLICEKGLGGNWLGAGSPCGGVPALPRMAYGGLALLLLAGTLALLTLHNRS